MYSYSTSSPTRTHICAPPQPGMNAPNRTEIIRGSYILISFFCRIPVHNGTAYATRAEEYDHSTYLGSLVLGRHPLAIPTAREQLHSEGTQPTLYPDRAAQSTVGKHGKHEYREEMRTNEWILAVLGQEQRSRSVERKVQDAGRSSEF